MAVLEVDEYKDNYDKIAKSISENDAGQYIPYHLEAQYLLAEQVYQFSVPAETVRVKGQLCGRRHAPAGTGQRAPAGIAHAVDLAATANRACSAPAQPPPW